MFQEQAPPPPDHYPITWKDALDARDDFMERKQPFPLDNSLIAEETPYGIGLKLAPLLRQKLNPHPLQMIVTTFDGMPSINVINGRIGGKLADSTMGATPFIIDPSGQPFTDLDFIWSKIPMAWDEANEWCLPTDDGTIEWGSAVPVPDDEWAYCQIGRISKSDTGALTVIEQNAAGNLALVRSGVVGNIVDKYFLGI